VLVLEPGVAAGADNIVPETLASPSSHCLSGVRLCDGNDQVMMGHAASVTDAHARLSASNTCLLPHPSTAQPASPLITKPHATTPLT
jgi:hypothetical protein